MEKKLVTILAEELPEWPEGAGEAVTQSFVDTEIYSDDADERGFIGVRLKSRHTEGGMPRVTRAQWEAERARIASKVSIELAGGRELDAKTEMQRKECESDQAFRARISEDLQMAKHKAGADELERRYAQFFGAEDQALWEKVAIACYAQNVQVNREREGAAICAFDDADAFMAERARRMKGAQ